MKRKPVFEILTWLEQWFREEQDSEEGKEAQQQWLNTEGSWEKNCQNLKETVVSC